MNEIKALTLHKFELIIFYISQKIEEHDNPI